MPGFIGIWPEGVFPGGIMAGIRIGFKMMLFLGFFTVGIPINSHLHG
jgi:hypothetical protein